MSMAESQLPRIGEPGFIGRLPFEVDHEEELNPLPDLREFIPESENEDKPISYRIRRTR